MRHRGFDRFEHQRGDVDTELRTARAETDRYAGLYADVCAKLDAARAEITRLEAELARTPVRLTADEAEKVRRQLWFDKRFGSNVEYNEALALLTPAGEDEA